MSLRTVLVVLLALVFGGSAAIGVVTLAARPAPAAAAPETVPVLLAGVDIPPFSVVTTEMLTTWDCPKDNVPPGALTRPEDALGRSALNPIVKGEPLLEGKLAPEGAGRGLAARIPTGQRAFTVFMPTVQAGVAGFILPTHRVDVLLILDALKSSSDSAAEGSSLTLLQNIEILAVEQLVAAPGESKIDPNQLKSVTLLVTPEQAAKLNLAQSKGKLALSLRNLTDNQAVSTRPIYTRELWGDPPPQPEPKEEPKVEPPSVPPVAAPPPPQRIRTLRGTSEGSVLINPQEGR